MQSEDLRDFYFSPNMCFQVEQTDGKGWVKSGSWMVLLWGKLNARERLVDGRIILQRILKKWGERLLIGFIWFSRGASAWNFVHVSGTSLKKKGKFFTEDPLTCP